MPAFPLLTWRWRMWIWTSVRSVVSAVKIVDQAYRMTFVIVFSCTRQVCQTGRLRSCFWKPRYSRRQKWVQKAQHTFWIYAIFCSLCDSDLVQWQGSYCCDGDEHGPYQGTCRYRMVHNEHEELETIYLVTSPNSVVQRRNRINFARRSLPTVLFDQGNYGDI